MAEIRVIEELFSAIWTWFSWYILSSACVPSRMCLFEYSDTSGRIRLIINIEPVACTKSFQMMQRLDIQTTPKFPAINMHFTFSSTQKEKKKGSHTKKASRRLCTKTGAVGPIISRVHLEHTAEITGLMQQIERFVDLFESQIMGDVFIDLDFLLNE